MLFFNFNSRLLFFEGGGFIHFDKDHGLAGVIKIHDIDYTKTNIYSLREPRKAMLLRVSPFVWVAMLGNWIPG